MFATKGRKTEHIPGNKFWSAIVALLAVSLLVSVVESIIARLRDRQLATPEEPTRLAVTQEITEQTIYEFTVSSETPPLTMGPKRLHYQYSVALPQGILTFVSVLQGIVFSLLLLNTPLLPSLHTLSWGFLLQQYLYLPYIISALVILIIWQQYVYATLFLVWPISLFQSTLIFLMTLAEILTFRQVGSLSTWLFGLGWVAIIGGGNRLNNLRFIAEETFEPRNPAKSIAATSRKNQIRDGSVYIISGIVLLAFGLGYDWFTQRIPLFPWIILVLLMGELGLVMQLYSRSRRLFLSQMIEGSDLVVSPHGLLGYKKAQNKRH